MLRIVVTLLLLTFLFRMIVLYTPGISAMYGYNSGVVADGTPIINNGLDHYSTTPGPDLNIPMVKESEENIKEQLFKAIKYPAPLIIFSLYLSFIIIIGSLVVRSLAGVSRRPVSRLYLSVSILRI